MKARRSTAMARLAGLVALTTLLTGHAVALDLPPTPLRLATTTSTYETGLLDHILPPFEKQHNAIVLVLSVGTGKALAIARAGDVDLILVHAREAEEQFVRDGYGVDRRDVMANDFVIAGPEADPAQIKGLRDAGAALRRIATSQPPFVSRGDDSGTHMMEKRLWTDAKIEPQGKWYIEAGQGMSSTLTLADEKDAYVLVDRASYIANRKRLRLTVLMEGDPKLLNPYGVIAVNPTRHPYINIKLAKALIEWFVSPECQKMIGEFTQDGQHLFKPGAKAVQEAGETEAHAE